MAGHHMTYISCREPKALREPFRMCAIFFFSLPPVRFSLASNPRPCLITGFLHLHESLFGYTDPPGAARAATRHPATLFSSGRDMDGDAQRFVSRRDYRVPPHTPPFEIDQHLSKRYAYQCSREEPVFVPVPENADDAPLSHSQTNKSSSSGIIRCIV